jgi:hypothetical protein
MFVLPFLLLLLSIVLIGPLTIIECHDTGNDHEYASVFLGVLVHMLNMSAPMATWRVLLRRMMKTFASAKHLRKFAFQG